MSSLQDFSIDEMKREVRRRLRDQRDVIRQRLFTAAPVDMEAFMVALSAAADSLGLPVGEVLEELGIRRASPDEMTVRDIIRLATALDTTPAGLMVELATA